MVKQSTPVSRTLALGLLAGTLLAHPVCHAGGAAALVPARDGDMPKGSQISEQRLESLEKKVEAHKVRMKADRTGRGESTPDRRTTPRQGEPNDS